MITVYKHRDENAIRPSLDRVVLAYYHELPHDVQREAYDLSHRNGEPDGDNPVVLNYWWTNNNGLKVGIATILPTWSLPRDIEEIAARVPEWVWARFVGNDWDNDAIPWMMAYATGDEWYLARAWEHELGRALNRHGLGGLPVDEAAVDRACDEAIAAVRRASGTVGA